MRAVRLAIPRPPAPELVLPALLAMAGIHIPDPATAAALLGIMGAGTLGLLVMRNMSLSASTAAEAHTAWSALWRLPC